MRCTSLLLTLASVGAHIKDEPKKFNTHLDDPDAPSKHHEEESKERWEVVKYGNERDYQVNKYSVHTDTVITELPPSAEEKASVDAINAWNAANQAAHAVQVVHAVAGHTEEIKEKASTALKNARDVLKEARVQSGDHRGGNQKASLRRAEKQLRSAVGVVEGESVSDLKSVKYRSNTDEMRVRRLQTELDRTLSDSESYTDEGELAHLERELEALRRDVASEEARRRQNSVVKAEIDEFAVVVRELEAAELRWRERKEEKDELKAELGKLREELRSMESKQLKFVPDTGSLHFELPPKKTLPLRTVAVPTKPPPKKKAGCPTAECLGIHGYGDEWK